MRMKMMSKVWFLVAAAFAVTSAFGSSVRSLDGDWQFRREGGTWAGVTVPHDWAIAGPFKPDATREEIDGGRLPYHGKGTYRRAFALTAAEQALVDGGGKAYLVFDGVQAHPKVYVNDEFAGGWDYGYVGFTLDVTKALKPGDNAVTVTADTTALSSRWYPGGGLYRSVWLEVKPREHVVPGTVAIVAEPDAAGSRAEVRVSYVSSLYGPTNFSFAVEKPRLWSVDSPTLYEVELLGEKFAYGIRTMKFTANDGFWLNGKRLQLKGVCLHSDLGPLGMAFDASAARRQLAILKDMGANAIRTSHNAAAPQFLDLCDRMGFVVWNECFDKWDGTMAKGDANLEEMVCRNLRAFVRRDRNHPSVAAWSIGNEIPLSTPEYPWGVTRERCRLFREAVLSEDRTRPVGIGAWEAVTVPCFADLDLTGWNYARRYMPMRQAFPDKPIVYTESCSSFSDYGFYQVPPARNRADYAVAERKTDGYDMTGAGYSDIPDVEFHRVEKDGFLAGEFVWTGFDYIGEPSPYTEGFRNAYFKDTPMESREFARSSYYGIVDLTGVPKDRFFLYRSYWNTSDETVHLLPHWNWKTGDKVPVFAYSSGDEAELFVNGRSLGRKRKVADVDYPLEHSLRDNEFRGEQTDNPYYRVCDKYRFRWYDVAFEPGEAKVVAYRKGVRVGEDVRKTAGKPVAVRLTVDPYSKLTDELVYVQVDVVDEKGVRCPLATDRISFAIEGGEIVSVGNGDPRGYDSFKATASHPLYFGKAVVIVRSKDATRLTASAAGLKPFVLDFTENGRRGESRSGLLCASAVSDAELNNSAEMNRGVTAPTYRRTVEGGVRVLFIGNSITLHAPKPSIGWTNFWGMAASAREKDFVHLVTAGIERKTGRKADLLVRNLADFERGFGFYDLKQIDDLVAFRPDYLVVSLGENVRPLKTESDRESFRISFRNLMKRFSGVERRRFVVKGAFWSNPSRDEIIGQVAGELGVCFVSAPSRGNADRALGLFAHAGIANHPGDEGMKMMADKVLGALNR